MEKCYCYIVNNQVICETTENGRPVGWPFRLFIALLVLTEPLQERKIQHIVQYILLFTGIFLKVQFASFCMLSQLCLKKHQHNGGETGHTRNTTQDKSWRLIPFDKPTNLKTVLLLSFIFAFV